MTKGYKTKICLLFRGIEWTSLTSFLSFAASTPNNMGLVRNELQLVDLPTGLCVDFLKDRGGMSC